ncbi:hypothetical protein [Paenibacillus sp.]|uniref:hypothetical protein n=1 Tax=Paenibacillus sp. TaxID=58172 RepID=UPI002D64F0FB|nr:hypothetical protein [Paenibacillus sp.]HZG84419.1 hypothetical protein [Paenibacillus sp.]
MDVGRLMRAVLGEASPAETKTAELRPGQVVRAVVLELFAENEALLQVGGTTVRAKLETPVAPGQWTLLQVQPDSPANVVSMRPLAQAASDVGAESFEAVLKSFGLKDTPLHRAVVRVLHEEGAPLSRATAASVAAAVEALAPSGDAEALLRAAATAVKRGLPATAETVRALHAAMSGPPATELLRALESGAREALAAPQTSAATKQAAAGLLAALERAETALGQALGAAGDGGETPAPGRAISGASSSLPSSGAAAAKPSAGQAPAGQAPMDPQPGALPQPSEASANAASPAGAPGAAGRPHGAAGGASSDGGAPPQGAPGAAPSAAAAAADEAPSPSGQARASAESAKLSAEETRRAPAETGKSADRPPLMTFLKLLGIDAEREWLKLDAAQTQRTAELAANAAAPTDEGAAETPARPGRPGVEIAPQAPLPLPVGAEAGQQTAQAAAEKSPAETLKSLLSQIAASDDAPPALKEAAQNALQSVTGQQLLLAQDKTAPFAHVAMFIPLKGPDGNGDGNAAVHIHTRRGKKGELDAENCRLWFQLSLAAIGETWVDVTVSNRVVGLHVWNDHPAVADAIAAQKTYMEAALKDIGYQLLAFKHSPKPKETQTAGGASAKPILSAYAPQTYKGVDLRV